MGKAILITGGARSGKSQYAEQLAKSLGDNILYIATAIPFDAEMKHRVRMHKESRPAEWDTYEGYRGLGKVIESKSAQYDGILLDCITVMVTNLLLEQPEISTENPDMKDFEKAEAVIKHEVEELVKSISKASATVIMVTNELGSGIVPENFMARIFRDIAGRVNQTVAAAADEVYLTVCGIPVKIK